MSALARRALAALVVTLMIGAAYAAGVATVTATDTRPAPTVTVCHTRAQTHCLWVDGEAHWQ